MQSSMVYLGIGLLCLIVVLFFLFRNNFKDMSSDNTSEASATPATEDKRSLYEKLGGEKAITPAVNIFYRKVLADDRIKHFFDGVDMHRQIIKQIEFLTLALGGPKKYTGADLRKGHAHLVAKGLNDSHFDAVIENLGATLIELKVPGELIAQAAAVVESTRNDVLGK